MIDVFSIQDLRLLADVRREHCVSIYFPTHPAGAETNQNSIRLKNLVAQAAQELRTVGEPADEVDDMLSTARALHDERAFWAHQGLGLAVFATNDRTWTYRLPDPVDELVVVADHLHIKPLVRSVSSGAVFYVLALSQNEVRLLRGSRDALHELELGEIPGDLASALRFDDRAPQLQSHAALRTGTGHVSATFHGQGIGKDDRDADVDRFLGAVDAGVCKLLDDHAPLVLAGEESVVARYRKLSRYPHLVDGTVTGNPEHLSTIELRDRSWPLAKQAFDAAQRDARKRILDDPSLTSATIPDVVFAARDGRVRSLFVAIGVQSWGHIDDERREVEEHDEHRPGDRDLLDAAVMDTLLTGGTVFVVPSSDVPAGGPLVAELRY